MASKDVKVTVSIETGVSDLDSEVAQCYVIYDLSGVEIMKVSVEKYSAACDQLSNGVYVVMDTKGNMIEKIVK